MAQLAQQQAAHHQQTQLRHTAQQLINEAYQQQRDNARVKRRLDAHQAQVLLDDAFPLTGKRHQEQQPEYSAAASPPSVSNSSAPSADFQRVRISSSDGKKYKQPKTALEKLLANGSLTGLPPTYYRNTSSSSLPGTSSRDHEGGSTPRPSVGSQDSHDVRSTAAVISRGIENLSPRDKNILLQAIRSELHAMQPPSAGD